MLLVIAGGTLIGLGRRKQQKQNNKYKLKAWIMSNHYLLMLSTLIFEKEAQRRLRKRLHNFLKIASEF